MLAMFRFLPPSPALLKRKRPFKGCIIKGIGEDFDWNFMKQCMVDGNILQADSSANNYQLIISSYIAKRLQLKVGDKTSLYIFNDQADPRQRNFIIHGIYETGLEDFDAQFVFTDIAHVQKLSGWGIRVEAQIDSTSIGGYIPLGAFAFGGDGDYNYQWTDSTWRGEGPHAILTNSDTTVQVVVSDRMDTAPDTAWLSINFADDSSTDPSRVFSTSVRTSGGSDKHYIGGYEVIIDDYESLIEADDNLFSSLTTRFLQTQKITDRNPEIFSWLKCWTSM
jgi:hypothetical protein